MKRPTLRYLRRATRGPRGERRARACLSWPVLSIRRAAPVPFAKPRAGCAHE